MEPIRFLFTRGRQDFVATIDVIYDLSKDGGWCGFVELTCITDEKEYSRDRDTISSRIIISRTAIAKESAFGLAVADFCSFLDDYGLYNEKERFNVLYKKIVG